MVQAQRCPLGGVTPGVALGVVMRPSAVWPSAVWPLAVWPLALWPSAR